MPFVRGVVFYSTPHFGSKLAGYASNPMISKVLSPSTDVAELNNKASHLPRLKPEFLTVAKRHDLPVLSFYEKKPLSTFGKGKLVVT